MVRYGNRFWLRPWVIWFVIWWRVVVVEWTGLKPCWCLFWGMLWGTYGRSTSSRILDIGDSKKIGRYEVPMYVSLWGLGIGMILANFDICGMMLWLRGIFNWSVRYWMASGPRCFRWWIFMWSGPIELLFDDLDIASETWTEVMCMGVTGKAFVCLSIFLLEVFVSCFTVFTNCWLKAEAFWWGVVADLFPKAMTVFGCYGGFLPRK